MVHHLHINGRRVSLHFSELQQGAPRVCDSCRAQRQVLHHVVYDARRQLLLLLHAQPALHLHEWLGVGLGLGLGVLLCQNMLLRLRLRLRPLMLGLLRLVSLADSLQEAQK